MNGNEIRERRKELGMTQVQVAVKVGVSLTAYQLWEHGVLHPNDQNAKKLKEVLQIDKEGETDG